MTSSLSPGTQRATNWAAKALTLDEDQLYLDAQYHHDCHRQLAKKLARQPIPLDAVGMAITAEMQIAWAAYAAIEKEMKRRGLSAPYVNQH
ncbi:MAG: hypothetical protein ACPGVO_04440 [Spirulinaceae cyanobacterium]